MFKEHPLISELINNDSQLSKFTQASHVINQGLTPIVSILNPSTELQKANLLQQVKHLNWVSKSKMLCKLLNQHNIKFIIFKGFAYNYTLYQQLPLRPHSDIDIFIDEKDYKVFENLLLNLNYNVVASRQGRFISFQNSFYDGNKINTVFDIHWQISNRTEIHPYFQFEKLYKSSSTITSSDFSFQTLDSLHTFIYACFHFQAHRPEDRKHIWLYDLALIWRGLTINEQEKCLNLALRYNLYDLVGGTLHILSSTFGKLITFNSINERPFKFQSNYLQPRNLKGGDFLQRLKNLKGVKEKALYLSEYLFQNKHYVQTRYKLRSTRWIYLFYPRMWLEDIIKLIKKP
jgi:hypothetical protein